MVFLSCSEFSFAKGDAMDNSLKSRAETWLLGLLGYNQQQEQSTKSLPEHVALFRQRYLLFRRGPAPEIVSLFIEYRTET
jgi:hypothetical protein